MQRILLFLCFLIFTSSVFAQATVSGCVYDEDEQPLIGASVFVADTRFGTVTDVDGCFSLNLPNDTATLLVQYHGYKEEKLNITPENKTDLVIKLSSGLDLLDEVVIIGSKPKKEKRVSSLKIKDLPTRNINSIAATAAGLSRSEDSAPLSIRGSRSDATDYYVDGVRVSDPTTDREPEAAGQLTAGEINDFGKWELWDDISKEDLAVHRSTWGFYPERRYTAQLTFPGGAAVVDAIVKLSDQSGKVLYEAKTDNQGRAELWAGLFEDQYPGKTNLILSASYAGQSYDFKKATPFAQGINSLEIPQDCESPTQVDVAFVIDATGSMGDEINYLKAELLDVMARSRDSLKAQQLNFSAVFYRDRGEEYVTRQWPFGQPDEKLIEFFNQQRAGGGGDNPEAVETALKLALNELEWSESASARLLFLVLDAPPHKDQQTVEKMQRLAILAAKKGVRIIPVVCSGMQQDGEYLFRSLALATNGTYTFLTDHSGIGNPHLEPSTDAYEVEQFNDLIVRLIHQFGASSNCEAPVALATKTNEEQSEIEWTAYPNPTTGPVSIELKTGKGSLSLYDLNGKLLQHHKVSGQREQLQLGQLPGGTYLLRYELDGQASSQRILVSR